MFRKQIRSYNELARGGGNALVVSKDGDAKLLEIGGQAAAAIASVRTLREMALEGVHGNRSSADRIAAAQSGRERAPFGALTTAPRRALRRILTT